MHISTVRQSVSPLWLTVSITLLFFPAVVTVQHTEVLYSVSQYGVCVCALRLRTVGGVDFCVILPPPTLPHLMLTNPPTLPLSLSLSPVFHPSYAVFLLLPRLQCKYSSLPCRTCDEKVTGSRSAAPPISSSPELFSPSPCARCLLLSPPPSSFSLSVSLCTLPSAPATRKGET